MPRRKKRINCKRCGQIRRLNRKGYCDDCAHRRSDESIYQLQAKQGPFYDKWKAGVLKGLSKAKSRYPVGVAQSLREDNHA